MVNFATPKGLGYQVANTVRQFVLSKSSTIRIVGFNLGDQTILSSGNIDLVSLSSDLASLDIELDDLETYPTTNSVYVSDVLTVGDLQKAGIRVINYPSDHIILDTMGTVTITFILNKCSCPMSSDDNKNLLTSQGVNVKGFHVISSRALDVKVGFNVKNNLNNDEVLFNIDSPEEKRIMEESLSSIIQVFQSISSINP